MKRAPVVVVGNDYLGDRARRAGAKRVEHIPTAVDLERYKIMPKSNGAPLPSVGLALLRLLSILSSATGSVGDM
ncbi:hypothetical protein [Acetomicrobium sp.]|uniref:hypothetical protein n=1 Tax=Acetomicrobium sp. TaxID=1872099 RepID=UPI002871779E|nr:hypothetical protein [Acetomicrobium sp.]MDR9769433.1 hypothetical protein [Acetomicrobium sp.]